MRKIILTIAAVAVVSSCSIYRKYQRPEDLVPVDSLYRAELVSPEEDAQAAEDSTSLTCSLSSAPLWTTTPTCSAPPSGWSRPSTA